MTAYMKEKTARPETYSPGNICDAGQGIFTIGTYGLLQKEDPSQASQDILYNAPEETILQALHVVYTQQGFLKVHEFGDARI